MVLPSCVTSIGTSAVGPAIRGAQTQDSSKEWLRWTNPDLMRSRVRLRPVRPGTVCFDRSAPCRSACCSPDASAVAATDDDRGSSHRRQRRKARHKHGRAPGDSGPDETCQATRKRGDKCEQTCECQGDYRCGAPRTLADRAECGQDRDADKVCCLRQGDTCGSNECGCCGTMVCRHGHCSGDCTADSQCPAGTRCVNGRCSINCYEDLDGGNGGCPPTCLCSRGNTYMCFSPDLDPCAPDAPLCTSNADCPGDWLCQPQECDGETRSSCVPLCSP
jgi:hypothetical protein